MKQYIYFYNCSIFGTPLSGLYQSANRIIDPTDMDDFLKNILDSWLAKNKHYRGMVTKKHMVTNTLSFLHEVDE